MAAFTCRFHSQTSNPSANTICVSPTTDTFAGAPLPNASVRNICPTVAATPMPRSISSTGVWATCASGADRGPIRNAARQNTVATAEKWTTIARGSMSLSECSPMW